MRFILLVSSSYQARLGWAILALPLVLVLVLGLKLGLLGQVISIDLSLS